MWTRARGHRDQPLDLLHARLVRRQYAQHMHAEYAIGACTTGLERISYRGAMRHSGPGSVVVIEPEEAHTGAPAVATGFTYRVLYPSVDLLREHDGAHRPHFREPVLHDPELAARLCAAHAGLSRAGTERLAAESLLVSTLDLLIRRHAEPAPETPLPGPVAHRVMARLADQLVDPPSLQHIADELGLSRFQLLRSFRNEVGMPPYAWLAQHRVARARGLLACGARPASVAAQVGFADQAHLTRWFQRVLGITPGAFARSLRSG